MRYNCQAFKDVYIYDLRIVMFGILIFIAVGIGFHSIGFHHYTISCKWVFKIKRENEQEVRYKARLVARGFS